MYTEWASLSPIIAANSNGAQSQSVLNKFAGPASREVTIAVVKQLAANLGLTHPAEPSCLTKDEEVLWCMDVICHGLTLPLQDHETIRDCVNVYCDWLTALMPSPRITVPKPICDDANIYARKMINHFHNLFVPRPGEVWPFIYRDVLGADTINRQAVICHRVLRTLQQVAQTSQILTQDTWETLLLFLLAINEVLLAPPIIKDDVGDQLCERVLSVLFEVWLLACVRCFPSPSLWKTLQESCLLLRHRIALIEQWNRINIALTARLLEFTYGSLFPELKIRKSTIFSLSVSWKINGIYLVEEDAQLIPPMSNDCIAQTWYRFLRTIGSPIALCSPQVISKTPQFVQWAVSRTDGLEPHKHPCLLMLPQIFFKAMKGIASQVDAFLGIYQGIGTEDVVDNAGTISTRYSINDYRIRSDGLVGNAHSNSSVVGGGISATGIGMTSSSSSIISDVPHSPTPPLQRRLAKSFSVASSSTQNKGLAKGSLAGLTSSRSSVSHHPTSTTTVAAPSSFSSISNESRPPLAPFRPKCNSILHLFGEWLFEAALIGGDSWLQNTKKEATEASRRPSSMIMDSRKGSLSQPSSLNESTDVVAGLTIDKYESGRAEAIGALCRIFCAKKTGEEILPVYLARFYTAIHQGLNSADRKECEESLASILYNSSDIFRVDLDGVQVLLPSFINALELVLPEKDLKIKSTTIYNKTELRRASIHILLSILTLPLHFQTLPIRDLNNGPADKSTTFAQLKPRLINVLMNALQVEADAQNTHMLLGGLLLCVQDSAIFEENDSNSEMYQSSPAPSDTNLLSSALSDKSGWSIASGSSAGGNSTLGNDLPSLTISDEFPADLFQDVDLTSIYDNAHALFVRATYLVCHRLISSWKTDLNVSLAALELLCGLARMYIKDSGNLLLQTISTKSTNVPIPDALECKRAVKWICDYICYQCSRPPPAHSKDLHSTIVAAFQCASAWLMQHPYLLQDKDCLTTILEVVELGISGSKSAGKPGEPTKLKEEKELKPASMRVRDAAEALLTIILEQVGYFPSECGPQSSSSLLDELSLYKYCESNPSENVTHEQAVQKFKYFVTENSTIIALLEEPLGNDQDPQPTVTLLIRGPFGRHAWTMQLRHLPRSKSGTKYYAPNPGRPVPMNDLPQRQEVEQKCFPDGVDRVPPCVADYSIPTLDQVIQKIGNDSTKKLFQLLESQTIFEKVAWAETDSSVDSLSHAQESVPPNVCHEFQAARLFLSHFGFLSIDESSDTSKGNDSVEPPTLLTVLDATKPGFVSDLLALDRLSSRTNDTLHVFYVKAGQSHANDIIDNMSDDVINTLDNHFWDLLLSLGDPVNVDEHAGWTGFLNNSWKIKPSAAHPNKMTNSKNDRKFNGEKRILYWADVSAEIAFVVPTKWNRFEDSPDGSCVSLASSSSSTESDKSQIIQNNYERSASVAPQTGSNKTPIGQKPRTLSLELDKNKNPIPVTSEPVAPSRRRTTVSKPTLLVQSGAKILLVWLESFEDHLTLPIDDLLLYSKTGEEFQAGNVPKASDVQIIFIHSLHSRLLRVKLQGPSGRMSFATPLIDGMVISRRVAGSLVRQTVYNLAKRKRLENDLYQPPNVRRRIKVQDIAHKYHLVLTEYELFAHLFKSNSNSE
ncbi:Ral GTPase-activating protein subunit beta [Pseudolycoriella hygida]|uniref:Ral GTPase-activating protein subunit beta n=1 Tax=Pseudolycoriella hygida TaxID=35572 RepID=A0A9Q0MLP7_9DIPT|nr:Ral GTPase-activating protein subunit beta [Pseudolycoriella hygida]